jgi:hypothetical protein
MKLQAAEDTLHSTWIQVESWKDFVCSVCFTVGERHGNLLSLILLLLRYCLECLYLCKDRLFTKLCEALFFRCFSKPFEEYNVERRHAIMYYLGLVRDFHKDFLPVFLYTHTLVLNIKVACDTHRQKHTFTHLHEMHLFCW